MGMECADEDGKERLNVREGGGLVVVEEEKNWGEKKRGKVQYFRSQLAMVAHPILGSRPAQPILFFLFAVSITVHV